LVCLLTGIQSNRPLFALSCIAVDSGKHGADVSFVAVGFLVDYCGRKETIIINDVIFLLGTVMLSAAHSFPVLVRRHLLLIVACLSHREKEFINCVPLKKSGVKLQCLECKAPKNLQPVSSDHYVTLIFLNF